MNYFEPNQRVTQTLKTEIHTNPTSHPSTVLTNDNSSHLYRWLKNERAYRFLHDRLRVSRHNQVNVPVITQSHLSV